MPKTNILPNSSCPYTVDYFQCFIDIFGNDASSKTIRGVICSLDHFIHCFELQYALHWPKDLKIFIIYNLSKKLYLVYIKYSGLQSKRFKLSPSHKTSETCMSSEKLRLGRTFKSLTTNQIIELLLIYCIFEVTISIWSRFYSHLFSSLFSLVLFGT